jgi:hypothetical protein
MVEVKLSDNRSMAQRVADRLKPSCADYGKHEPIMADTRTTTLPTRTEHGFHNPGSVKAHGGRQSATEMHGRRR